jgi:hypothetical protein
MCDGTMGIVGDPTRTLEPITKIGLSIKLAAGTVASSGWFMPRVARIDSVDARSAVRHLL